MAVFESFSKIWGVIVTGNFGIVFDLLSSPVRSTISDFIGNMRADNPPYLIDLMLKAMDKILPSVIPADITIFGLMVGSALSLFIIVTVVKWIIGIVT